MHCIFFIHSFVNEQVGCFYPLAFIKSVTHLLELLDFPDICPGMGLLDHMVVLGFPGDSDGKVSVYNVRDLGLIPGSGRFPGEGNGNPLQYS